MTCTYIGVDPGATGGITVIDGDRVTVHPMPGDEEALWDLIGAYRKLETRILTYPSGGPVTGVVGHERVKLFDAVAVIEKVGGFVKGNPTPGSAMFNFGVSYGQLRMALVAAGIPFVAVTPQRWQAEFGLVRAKDEKKYTFKSRLAAKARELFPSAKFNRDCGDSVLLADYCRRHHTQLFPTKS